MEEARAIDAGVAAQRTALEGLRGQLTALDGAGATLDLASARSRAAREALPGTAIESVSADLAALGADPAAAIRQRRQQESAGVEAARRMAGQAGAEHSVAEERSRSSKVALDAAVVARDAALAAFPEGLAPTLAAARTALAEAVAEEQQIRTEIATQESAIAAEQARIAAAVSGTTAADERPGRRECRTTGADQAVAQHAASSAGWRNAPAARRPDFPPRSADAVRRTTGYAVPSPERSSLRSKCPSEERRDENEIRPRADRARIQRTHAPSTGGGSRARTAPGRARRFESAEAGTGGRGDTRPGCSCAHMKEAAPAASIWGRRCAAIAGRFEELTRKRYQNVRLERAPRHRMSWLAGRSGPTDRIRSARAAALDAYRCVGGGT